jgi:predicted RND superfamily exporter protein
MKKLLSKKGKIITIVVFSVLLVVSIALAPLVKINYDMSSYLPKDSVTKQTLKLMKDEFGVTSNMEIMIEEDNLFQGEELQEELSNVKNVKGVTWLGSVVDITQPIESYPREMVEAFYKDGKLLYMVEFLEDEYSSKTDQAINDIKVVLNNYDAKYRGEPIVAKGNRDLVFKEGVMIMSVVVPIAIIILFIFSTSWIEPVVILINLIVAIVINLGTNCLMPSVSFLTMAIASALQLAMSLDYSLFFIHRYMEKREEGMDVMSAVSDAMKGATGSVTASALTTIFGFLALLTMRYTLGTDIGISLSKAVFISFLTAIFLMPLLLVTFDKLLFKTKHRRLVPEFKKLGKGIQKVRWGIVAVLLIIAGTAFYFQGKTKFFYGAAGLPDPNKIETRHDNAIGEVFGFNQPVVVLYKNEQKTEAINFAEKMLTHERVRSIQSLVTTIDPEMPIEIVPEEYLVQFMGENYSRMIININLRAESEEMYEVSDFIIENAEYYFGEAKALGVVTSLTEIKEVSIKDGVIVAIVSVLAIMLVIAIVFKSALIPVVLVLLIQTAIWVNIAAPYFQDKTLSYIGYLVVSSLQLGATIDYAVLLTSRYQEFRVDMKPKEASIMALTKSSHSIIVSSLVLAVAGFSEALLSRVEAVSEMGELIGFGALYSGIFVLFALPALLSVLDKPIQLLTYRKKEDEKHEEKNS